MYCPIACRKNGSLNCRCGQKEPGAGRTKCSRRALGKNPDTNGQVSASEPKPEAKCVAPTKFVLFLSVVEQRLCGKCSGCVVRLVFACSVRSPHRELRKRDLLVG